ncbi:MAG: ribonuclease III [Candidatus Onthoplasma sp.]
MRNKSFLELFEQCDDELKQTALTHSSFANQHGVESNERLEFLGDTVLSTIVSDYLYKHQHQSEGKMSKIRSQFVCTKNLSNLAKEIGIEKRIRFGKSFQGKISDAILEDTIESMIGAIYLTYGLHSIQSAVLDALKVKEMLKKGMKVIDSKSELQEFVQSEKERLEYKVEKYITAGGQENFRASVFVDGKFISYGQGSTKREAEQNGAKKAIKKLKDKN